MHSYYSRKLPHWQPEGADLFITWRLHGSKPRNCDAPRTPNLTAGRAFVVDDREWDRAATGPKSLSNPEIARIVVDALQYGEKVLKLYTLRAWVVMSNHVHLLIYPQAPLARINKTIKNYTARRANQALGRTGQAFWAQESYDRWIRTEQARDKAIKYIEANPVAVGLCARPEDWRWSSGWTGQEAYPTETL